MRRWWTSIVIPCVMGFAVAGCADDVEAVASDTAGTTPDVAVVDTNPAEATFATSVVPPSEEATNSTVSASAPSFLTMFAQLPYDIEIIGFDDARDQLFSDTRFGNGPPVRGDAPVQRLALELTDDGLSTRSDEQHATVWGEIASFDIYWDGHGITEVTHADSGVDALLERRALRVDIDQQGRTLLFEDVTDGPGTSRTTVLRQHSFDGGFPAHDWTHEFDAPIVFSFLTDGAVIVGTGANDQSPDGTVRAVHVLGADGTLRRSMPTPPGLVWIQPPARVFAPEPMVCDDQLVVYPGGLGWVIKTNPNQILVACRMGRPVSSAPWGGGMGEFFVSMDANSDGIEEVFVGGTSVGGGGGMGFSLIGDELRPILAEDGQLVVHSGHVGEAFGHFGCRDGFLVQIHVRTAGTTATATREFIEIAEDRATVVNTELIEWQIDEPITEPFALWEVWEEGPSLTEDLSDCWVAPSFDRVLAAAPDGTVLLSSIEMLPSASPCGSEMPLVTWKNGVARASDVVDGQPFLVHIGTDGALRLRIGCPDHVRYLEGRLSRLTIESSSVRIGTARPEHGQTYPLASTDLLVKTEPRESNDDTCEVNYELRRLLVGASDEPMRDWLLPSGEPFLIDWIEAGGFVSTDDGRFVVLSSFSCAHEGPDKTIYSGTYDTATGALRTVDEVVLPQSVTVERHGWVIDFPDVLSVNEQGQIVGWIATGESVESVVIA